MVNDRLETLRGIIRDNIIRNIEGMAALTRENVILKNPDIVEFAVEYHGKVRSPNRHPLAEEESPDLRSLMKELEIGAKKHRIYSRSPPPLDDYNVSICIDGLTLPVPKKYLESFHGLTYQKRK